MHSENTRQSLLQKVKAGDFRAWERLAALYRPFITNWAAGNTSSHADAEDLAQEILLAMVRSLPRFEHNGRPGAFRTWLRTVAVHATSDYYRARRGEPRGTGDAALHTQLQTLEDPSSDLAIAWDREHDQYVLNRLIEMAAAEFEPQSMEVFRRLTLEGASADVVARDLKMSPGAVYTTKSRVMTRLRELSDGLLDWDADADLPM